MKTTLPEPTKNKCDQCDYVAVSPQGLNLHKFRAHTPKGQKLARQAVKRMAEANRNKPRKNKPAKVGRPRKLWSQRIRSLDPDRNLVPSVSEIQTALKKREQERVLDLADQLHGNNSAPPLRFCPGCGCHLEAIVKAMTL